VGLALVILVYGGGYLLWYLGTPLGRAPQLDGRENLELAAQIAGGTLPHELFYRAMLYPAALAAPLLLGWPTAWLPGLAAVLGMLCHFAATLAVARLAARIWAGPRAGAAAWVAAALWGLNPVAIFYAVDVLDVTPALALYLWGLVWLAQPGARARDAMAGGVLVGLAVAMRPHFLPVALIAPVARAWLAGRWRPVPGDGWAWAGAALPLLAAGLAQWAWAGEFRVLPWQGAYNFYAANRLGANGRYYAQRMFFADLAPGENPTRKESELLYAQETGAKPPFDIAAMEGYWRARAWAEIEANPAAWLKLMGRKAYYLFNDFDQYNNKTYAWHQERSPWLRWNFLSWGILLVLAAAMLPLGWAAGETRRRTAMAGLLLVFAVYGAGVLVYYASGRFRLPLAPLLCVLAGGWAGWPEVMKRQAGGNGRGVVVLAGLAVLIAGFVSATNFFGARDESTFIQDELLSANAAAEVGEDAQAYAMAEQALAQDGKRPDARRIALVSYFNMAVAGEPGKDAAENWRKQLPLLDGLELRDPALTLAAGAAWWKTGDEKQAEQVWQDGAKRFGADSPPAQALAAARYLRKESVRNAPAPIAAYLEYLARPN
jgi:4-amino-4-deoxy-L-arabinose transferase-like glycosyltransferase